MKERKKGFIVLGIVAILGILYNAWMLITKKDPLNIIVSHQTIFEKLFNEKCCSWWPITHFILYLILGIVAPKHHLLWFFIGIIWELIEFTAGVIFYKKGESDFIPESKEYGRRWWKGSFKDLVFNGAGLYAGILIRKLYEEMI